MSNPARHKSDNRRTKPAKTPTYHEIAARLECDAETLRRFVIDHPNPSVAIILGWATADPAHADAVERWLAAREETVAATHDRLVEEHDADDLTTSGPTVFTDTDAGSTGGEA